MPFNLSFHAALCCRMFSCPSFLFLVDPLWTKLNKPTCFLVFFIAQRTCYSWYSPDFCVIVAMSWPYELVWLGIFQLFGQSWRFKMFHTKSCSVQCFAECTPGGFKFMSLPFATLLQHNGHKWCVLPGLEKSSHFFSRKQHKSMNLGHK